MKDLSIGGIILLDNTSGEAEEIVEPMEVSMLLTHVDHLRTFPLEFIIF